MTLDSYCAGHRPEPLLESGGVTMCTLCRRNLMAGERFRLWKGGRPLRSGRPVCGLCEPVAKREGWLREVEVPHERENANGLSGSVRLVA
jgi:hypothetical protein